METPLIQEDSKPIGLSFIGAIVGGLVGALLGSALWAVIGIVTEYEVGYVAIAVGFLSGGGVVLLGRQRGIPYQMIAVLMSLVGLFAGKYYLYFHYSQIAVVEQYGQQAWDSMQWSVLSPEFFQFFLEDIGSLMEPLDILFIILAIITAWSLPSNRNATQAQEPTDRATLNPS